MIQNFFIKISQQIEKKPIYQHLLFALATIITICSLGYYFGTFDQASHIPFLKKNFDASLYPHDLFFNLRSSHYSFFWLLFIPFYRWGILEISMFIIHILATYFTYFTIWKLTKTIFSNSLTSLLSIIAFILPHISFAGFTVFEFSLLNRTFVLPFLLLAIDYYLKKYYWLAYLILGLMYNFHLLSVNFVLAMFLFDSVLRLRKVGLKNLIISIFLFFLTASPVFIWKSANSHLDFTINLKWYEIVKNGILNNVFNMTATNPPLIFLTLSGLASIIVFFATRKYLLNAKEVVMTHFVFAGLIVLLTQIITSYFLPMTIIIQSQIIRIGIFLLIFSYLFFCHFLARLTIEEKINDNQFLLLLIGLLLSVSPILLIVILFVYKSKNVIKPFLGIIIVASIVMFIIIAKLDLWRPGIHIYPHKLTGYQIQSWVKKNTPQDAVFIAPPHLWWFYNLEWRVISERSTIVTLSELLEAAFEPRHINDWQTRFNDLAPGALPKFKGNALDNFVITKKAYYSLSDKDMKKIAKKYQASYLVVEKPYSYRFPLIYEDNEFRLYKIK